MEKLKMHSLDNVEDNIKKIGNLFPNCLTEIKNDNGEIESTIDFDKLKQELSNDIVEGRKERYQFTWPDKKKSMLLANSPIAKTLRPCKEESVDFDNTENLYIEGDNLEVLKLLQETYLGKIKMIYIDPPYNTGNDFVYEDNFSQKSSDYLENSGQFDEEGNRLVKNLESNGRFHTDWLNMMYPRLKLARNLLTEDGVIFINIDEKELSNTQKICDEILGNSNFINIISIKMKNIAGASGGGQDKKLKKNIEYLLVYSKNYSQFDSFKNIYDFIPIDTLIQQYKEEGKSWKYTSVLLYAGDKEYIASTLDGDGNEIKIFSRKNQIIKSVNSVCNEENLSIKEVYNKYSKQIFQTAMPQSSIRPRVIKKLKELEKNEDFISIEYVPRSGKNKGIIYEQFYKGNKYRLLTWLSDVSEKINGDLHKKELQGTFWDYTKDINNLTKEGNISFPNGKKPLNLIKRLISMNKSKNQLILDFFSGSATTAHAVMQLNAEDEGNRKFIMVQLSEKTDSNSESYKAGYKNICEIGKERIRRAGKKIKEETPLTTQNLDIGFRVLKCDSNNMKDVYYKPEEYEADLFDSLKDNIKEDRTSEDLLFQVMLDLGVLLSSTIQETIIEDKKIFNVANGYLLACFEDNITEEIIIEIAKQKPYYFVMRDSSLADDNVLSNFDQIFATYSPDTIRKVL